jgi:IclR family pca regulon transcriptional regulator
MSSRTDEPAGALTEPAGALIQSLERGLAVIRAFDRAGAVLSITEIAANAGITRAAARRFVLTLIELGYVVADGQRFALRPTVLELGPAHMGNLSLPEVARPHMRDLVSAAGDSAALSVLTGHEISFVAIERVSGVTMMVLNVRPGSRLPAHATSMGRVLLAAQPGDWIETYLATSERSRFTEHTVIDAAALREILAAVSADGYSIVDQELALELLSVAVPVHDPAGVQRAALNVSMLGPSRDKAVLADVMESLRITAARIEADLAAIRQRRSALFESDGAAGDSL